MRLAWRQRGDPLYTSRMKSLSFALVALAACAGTQQEETLKPTAGTGSAGPAKPTTSSGDVSVELPASTVKAGPVEPGALTRPDFHLFTSKRGKTTLDKQRGYVKAAKDPLVKQAEAAVLVTMLYQESKTNHDKEKDLFAEARQVLRDVAAQVGDAAIDDATLRLLGSYEIIAEDWPAAEKAWQGVIDKDPKSKEMPYNHAWLAYSRLRQFKNAEALAAVAADKLDDKQPELAYVTAWAKLRTGDAIGAWQAILVAVKGWGKNLNRDELERDVLLIAAHAPVPVDQAITAITTQLAQSKQQGFEQVARLGIQSYPTVGRWTDAAAALEKALELAGSDMPANYLVRIRYSQAEFSVSADAPDAAVRYARQAVEALTPCGAKCSDQEKSDTVEGAYYIGQLFHVLFATANDKRFYQPAHDLYALTIPLLSAALKPRAEKDAKTLEATAKNIKAGTGTHDKGVLAALLGRRDNNEIAGCYELGLGGNPKLSGTLTLEIESDATGKIKGAATEPKAGQADMAAVAGCVAEHAKLWRLPARGMPGTTRVKLTYQLALKK
jgi:tetratricopeptide (TPR) repeat protein